MKRKHWLAIGTAAFVLIAWLAGYAVFIHEEANLTIEAPDAEYDFEYDSQYNSITIQHVGGDTFQKPKTGAIEIHVSPNGTYASPVTTVPLPFDEGDSVTVTGVEEDDRVVIIWRGGGGLSAELATYSVSQGKEVGPSVERALGSANHLSGPVAHGRV